MEITKTQLVTNGKQQGYAKGAVVTGAKGLAFLSGTVGTDPKTGELAESMSEQTKNALEQIKLRLEELGTSLENILHVTMYLVGKYPDSIMSDPEWKECARAWEHFWRDNCPELAWDKNPPANTLVGVTALAGKGLKLELQVIAAVP